MSRLQLGKHSLIPDTISRLPYPTQPDTKLDLHHRNKAAESPVWNPFQSLTTISVQIVILRRFWNHSRERRWM
jgi:hypothetical protein